MTGLPAAFSALAFASTARVADSVMLAIRRETRRSAGGRAADGGRTDVGSGSETAVMPPSCQRRAVGDDAGGRDDRGRRGDSSLLPGAGRRWLATGAVPYTGPTGAADPGT